MGRSKSPDRPFQNAPTTRKPLVNAVPLERRKHIVALVECPEPDCAQPPGYQCLTKSRSYFVHSRRIVAGLRHPDFKW